MVNGVSVAKLPIDQNFCTLDDMEICQKNVQLISDVGFDGYPTNSQQVYHDEAVVAYYYCNECHKDWTVTATQTQEQAWQLAKEHLNG